MNNEPDYKNNLYFEDKNSTNNVVKKYNIMDFLSNIDFLTKVDEHKQLFPLANLEGQILKLEEELNESQNAQDNIEFINEVADCVICCIGIYRWAPLVSRSYLAWLTTRGTVDVIKQLITAVNNKWQINLNRT